MRSIYSFRKRGLALPSDERAPLNLYRYVKINIFFNISAIDLTITARALALENDAPAAAGLLVMHTEARPLSDSTSQ